MRRVSRPPRDDISRSALRIGPCAWRKKLAFEANGLGRPSLGRGVHGRPAGGMHGDGDQRHPRCSSSGAAAIPAQTRRSRVPRSQISPSLYSTTFYWIILTVKFAGDFSAHCCVSDLDRRARRRNHQAVGAANAYRPTLRVFPL